MGKILFWVVAILAGMIVMRVLNHQKSKQRQSTSDPRREAIRQRAEEMVPCAHCDVYLPESQAYKKQGQYWCSPEHAKKGASRS